MVRGNQEFGVSNRLGWQYRGFIEDREGKLRPQTHEELVFCVGCHSGIGATSDSNFSFTRKLDDVETGYLSGVATIYSDNTGLLARSEKKVSPEFAAILAGYAGYFEHNGSLNDFRNLGINVRGPLTAQRLQVLLWPDEKSAMLMNKAYRTIVQEQSFTRGRDAVTSPLVHILHDVEEGATTGVTMPVQPD